MMIDPEAPKRPVGRKLMAKLSIELPPKATEPMAADHEPDTVPAVSIIDPVMYCEVTAGEKRETVLKGVGIKVQLPADEYCKEPAS